MKKRLVYVFTILSIMILFVGCGNAKTSKTYTFNVETGDSVKVKLDTSDKYNITSEVPFEISQDGDVKSQGTFIFGEAYEQYKDVVDTDENAELLDSGNKDGNEYVFWSYNDSEYNYAILIKGSSTGLILANDVSEESAKECFNRLTIEYKD
ncbi:MAG TPA: hypothetical protein GX705_07145 [Clostridiales bacterium]|nr:hypothetical protein [Clostridiales bacterium]